MYFIPSTVDTVKKILDFPENVIIVYSFKSSTIHSFKTISRLMLLLPLIFSIFLIVGGSILGLQFISVILAGIQASELKKSQSNTPLITPEDVEEHRPTYTERAREKYNLEEKYGI